jgi:hypothetical protein
MINIGDRVNANDLSVPVGTSMEYEGTVWTREVDGWHSDGSHYNQPNQCQMSGLVTGVVPYVETLAMHQQRFAVTCITMGVLAGGGGYLSGAREIVDSLGLTNPPSERLRVGSWVSAVVNAEQVPVGAVLLSGARDRAEGHSLFFKVDPYEIRHLSGPRRSASRLLTQVVALPADYDTDDWPEPAEDEAEQIRLFRIRSWDVGFQVKTDRGWCPDFESNISVLGLSRNVADALRREGSPTVVDPGVVAGAVCTADLMDAAPVGTIVTEGPGSFTATKEATCWRQWSTGGEIHPTDLYFHEGLRFHSVPDVAPVSGFLYGQLLSNEEQVSCALGAVFAYPGEGETRFVMGRTDEGAMHGTRNIQPNEVGAHYGSGHRLIWDGSSPIHEVRVQDHAEMVCMPVGTVIGEGWDGEGFANIWVKTAPDVWTADHGGTYASGNFTLPSLRYAYIPVPGVNRLDAPVVEVEEDDDEF